MKVIELPDFEQLRSDAAAWVAKLDAGGLTAEDLAALRDWAGRSRRHRATLEEVASQWDDLNVLSLYREIMSAPRQHWRWSVAGAAAAGIAAVVFLLSQFFAEPRLDSFLVANGSYATVVGELRTISLPDGSEVRMNTNSRLEVSYSPAARAMRLLQGEAYFQVAKDKALPFSVQARGGQVVAVGTAFAVRLRGNRKVQVTVSEGRVKIAANETAGAQRLLIGKSGDAILEAVAGQTVVFERAIESVEMLDSPEIERRLSWRGGMLMFNGDTLESVVEEVSRYTAMKIVISDPALRHLKVGGYFRAGDTDVMLRTLENDFGIEADRVSADLVYLRSRTR